MRRVYLDNNATTPVAEEVYRQMQPYFCQSFGNAASIHGFGQEARAAIEVARQEVADLIGAQTGEIVFTGGGTEADNTVVRGVAAAQGGRGGHIITSTIEHPAVLAPCAELERAGFRVTRIPVDAQGQIDLTQLEAAIDAQTVLISLIHGNNEVGSIQRLERVAEIAGRHGVLFHTDAVQTVGKIPVDVRKLGVDLLSLSAHKLHGPKGVGALFVRNGLELAPLLLGGSHERGRRAGTENVAGAVGLGAACRLARASLEEFSRRVGNLRDRLENGLLQKLPGLEVNGSRRRRLPHVSNLSFEGLEGEALLIALDFKGIAVSTGAACASGSMEPSHVLLAMKLPRSRVQSALRFSLSRLTQDDDIDYVLEAVPEVVNRMRRMSVAR